MNFHSIIVNGLHSNKTLFPVFDNPDNYQKIWAKTQTARNALLTHPIYQQVNNLTAIKIFMRSHIFAVWDFMTLLKTLQHRLTGLGLPWLPPTDVIAARFINEIVLTEETDEVTPGNYLSHFHLYLGAMEEVGADTQPINKFVNALQRGKSPQEALASLTIPTTTKSFVEHTLTVAQRSTHEIAAVFLLGREDIIPQMFGQLITQLEVTKQTSCDSFRLYLERHTELDAKQHAPLGQQLLMRLCGNDRLRWQQALVAADRALKVRKALWDGIGTKISQKQLFK